MSTLPRARPRVFVSSVVEDFAAFREAARRGIEAAGAEAILVNEDFPSLASSSRNGCLDAVESCDYFLVLVGERGGWTAPSGKLVVEEEYEHALSRKLPVLAFLQHAHRDAEAERLARKISDFIDGSFRRTFATAEELEREVKRALDSLLMVQDDESRRPRPLTDYFGAPNAARSTPVLRFVLVPERVEEVIDPVTISSDDFKSKVHEIAHSAPVRLLSYERPKTTQIEQTALAITQTESTGRSVEGEYVRLEIRESGEVIIDANVAHRRARDSWHDMLPSMVVALEDVEHILKLCFRFAAVFYGVADPHKRHQVFIYNVGLSGLEHRALERNPQPRRSYTMSMRNRDLVVVAHESMRRIHRRDLEGPESEIARTVELLTRKAQ